MDALIWLVLACVLGFFGYVLYTRQFKWLLGVIRNIIVGIVAILIFNMMFYYMDLDVQVGVNTITAMVVGVLGAPGFILLYAIQMLL